MTESAIAVMAKKPVPGQVKTRLCPPLSYEEAAELYQATCQDVIENALSLKEAHTVIAAAPAASIEYFQSLAPGAEVIPVEKATIGRCLEHATTLLLKRDFDRVLAVSSDSPDLWPDLMQAALDLLDNHNLVLGPTRDGGYYLIGLKDPQPELFADTIAWSTEKVMPQTLAIAAQVGLSYALLPSSVTDLDRADDLPGLRQSLAAAPANSARWTRLVLQSLDSSGVS